ncbi:hypothetical protein [Labrenzia sp. PHM005]|uniref:hypothetical protein n=1 Tax=Labrenzia sp. PHM005 TaxID=2590016 RepID=UPI00143CE8E7|nr:hypothetical protein [Labrenzia sp. PHM005]
MISAIVDGVLLLALVVTTIRMVQMHKDLRRLGSYHEDYQRIFDQTALALDGIEVSIQEINVKGAQILNALGSRMDDARDLIAEIDALTREAKRQQSVLKSELKELSKSTALMQKADRFTPTRDDLELYGGDVDPAHRSAPDSASSPQDAPVIHRGTGGPKTPTRVHKIDNTLGSPFRSVSMNQKDTF